MRDRDDEVEFEPFDALLEEAVAIARPRARSEWPRRLAVAAVMLFAIAMVIAVALQPRPTVQRVASPPLPSRGQDPQQQPDPEPTKPKDVADYVAMLDQVASIRLRIAEPVLVNRTTLRMQPDARCSQLVAMAEMRPFVAALREAAKGDVTHQTVDNVLELWIALRDGRCVRGWFELADKNVLWVEGLDDIAMPLDAAFAMLLREVRQDLATKLRLRDGRVKNATEVQQLPAETERLVLPVDLSTNRMDAAIRDHGWLHLERFVGVKDLTLMRCDPKPEPLSATFDPRDFVEWNGLVHIALFQTAARLPSLERIAVRQMRATDALIETLAPSATLRSITLDLHAGSVLDDRPRFTGTAFSKLTQLREVHLLACPDLTVAGLDALARLHLDTLEVRGGAPIVPRLRSLFATLRRLTIGDDAAFDDAQLDVVLSSKLEDLHLPHTGVTIAGIRKLRDLPTLRLLDLTGCAITDDDIAELARFDRLRELDVTDTKVTDRGLVDLRERLPKTIVRASWRQEPVPPMK